jgi:hypothetical protein
MEVIPLSAIPISRVSTASVTEFPSATPLTSLEKTADLAKSMEKMNLQETEINRLKKEIENLQELKSSGVFNKEILNYFFVEIIFLILSSIHHLCY